MQHPEPLQRRHQFSKEVNNLLSLYATIITILCNKNYIFASSVDLCNINVRFLNSVKKFNFLFGISDLASSNTLAL